MANSRISDAITIMKVNGWAGSVPPTVGNPKCMHLAISTAYERVANYAGKVQEHRDDLTAVANVCREQYPTLAESRSVLNDIWAVNDEPGRTFDEIERIMEKAYIHRCSEMVD